jgi:hypothetical protein
LFFNEQLAILVKEIAHFKIKLEVKIRRYKVLESAKKKLDIMKGLKVIANKDIVFISENVQNKGNFLSEKFLEISIDNKFQILVKIHFNVYSSRNFVEKSQKFQIKKINNFFC